jgi:hypothetical protein
MQDLSMASNLPWNSPASNKLGEPLITLLHHGSQFARERMLPFSSWCKMQETKWTRRAPGCCSIIEWRVWMREKIYLHRVMKKWDTHKTKGREGYYHAWPHMNVTLYNSFRFSLLHIWAECGLSDPWTENRRANSACVQVR